MNHLLFRHWKFHLDSQARIEKSVHFSGRLKPLWWLASALLPRSRTIGKISPSPRSVDLRHARAWGCRLSRFAPNWRKDCDPGSLPFDQVRPSIPVRVPTARAESFSFLKASLHHASHEIRHRPTRKARRGSAPHHRARRIHERQDPEERGASLRAALASRSCALSHHRCRRRRAPCRACCSCLTAADIPHLGGLPCLAPVANADGTPMEAVPYPILGEGCGAPCRRHGGLRRRRDARAGARRGRSHRRRIREPAGGQRHHGRDEARSAARLAGAPGQHRLRRRDGLEGEGRGRLRQGAIM